MNKLYTKLNGLKKRAKAKKIPFDLDIEWLNNKLKLNRCEASNIPLSQDVSSPFYPTIDRIDSSKGYTKDNCIIVAYIINLAKGEYSYDDLYNWAKHFIKNYEEKYNGTTTI